MMSDYELYHGDCLAVLPTLPAASVDAVIADPPYGTTACKWDSVIPLDRMWAELKRVIKPKGAIVLFAAQPFTSALVMSNVEWFKYEWVWDKVAVSNFLNVRRQPLRKHESILVFSRGQHNYNPQISGKARKPFSNSRNKHSEVYNDYGDNANVGVGYPQSIITVMRPVHLCDPDFGQHPTQKPVDLLCYLVRTYTNVGETVLDFTMVSGTTGVACLKEQRDFIGIELDRQYFEIAKRRIAEAAMQMPLLSLAAD